jgi:hypothetical protein
MPTRPTLDIKAEMSLNHTPERSAMPTSLNLDIRAEGSTNHTPGQSIAAACLNLDIRADGSINLYFPRLSPLSCGQAEQPLGDALNFLLSHPGA